MRYFIENLKDTINNELSKDDINLIKIEGIETPEVYKEVCEYFKSESLKSSGAEFIGKLSLEKYEEFKSISNSEWSKHIDYLERNEFVDFDAAMTKWRNSIANNESGKDYKLVLLMGTESVQDKGGLADFCTINLERMIKSLGKNKYYKYFNEFVNEETIGENVDDIRKVTNKIIENLFSIYPVDLIKLSYLAEKVKSLNSDCGDEFVENIFKGISDIWKLPILVSDGSKITFNSIKGNKSLDIIAKADKFINRRDYRTKVPNLDKIGQQIEKYIDENYEISDSEFNTLNREEFKDTLLDFVRGKNYEKNKEKLLNIDFSIINDILKVKISKEKSKAKPKDKFTPITGAPLEILLKIILQSINEYQKSNQYENPSKLEVGINKITLGNCVDKTEMEHMYEKICRSIGGLINFINGEEYKLGDNILEIEYKNNKDIFNFREGNGYEILNRTKTISEFSKIEINVNLSSNNGEKEEYLYKWVFDPNNYWVSIFNLLEETFDSIANDKEYNIPFMWTSKNLKNLISSESEGEFFNKLDESKFDSNNYILNMFKGNSEVNKKLGLIEINLRKFIEEIRNLGLYSCINNINSSLYEFLKKYTELIDYVIGNINTFSSVDKDKLYLIYNLFNISESEKYGVKAKEYNCAIVPPIHPIMLEKLIAQKQFLRNGFKELINSMAYNKISKKLLEAKIDKIIQLSTITNGADVIIGVKNELLAEKVMGNYVVYAEENECGEGIDASYNGDISFDEDINIGDMLITTPESEVFSENITDYLKIFPVKIDGLKIAVINPEDLQYVVSGINTAVNCSDFDNVNIKIKLTIIREMHKTNGIEYLRYWLDNKLSEKDNVDISTFVINKDFNDSNILKEIEENLKRQDIIFIHNILKNKSIEYKKLNSNNSNYDEAKFPMVFPPQPLSKTTNKRQINVTQKQFDVAFKHTQLGIVINHSEFKEGEYRVLKEVSISEFNSKLIKNVHDISNWVICMDEAIDKEIISDDVDGKVVGFTTGKGNYGELNITVSANSKILEDIKFKLKKRLKERFSSWREDDSILEAISQFCINKAQELDGGKILKALNNNDYSIHNLLSYIITLQYLEIPEKNDDSYIKILLNLDSHMHWFEEIIINEVDERNDNKRPDLLLIDVRKDKNKDSNKLIIDATVIECKMGVEDNEKKSKAIQQVENGIKILSKIWDESKNSSKRYWFNQLYRALIFSRINIDEDSEEYLEIISKIENVLEGKFDINWNGKIFTYWLNSKSDSRETEIEIEGIKGITSDIKLIECGQVDIKRMILPVENRNMILEYEEEKTIEIVPMEEYEEVSFNEKVEKHKDIINKMDSNSIENKLNNVLEDGNKTTIEEGIKVEQDEFINEKDPEYDEEVFMENEVILEGNELSDIRVLIGKDENTQKEIYWEYGHKKLNNRHLFISGTSGSGKTYCIQCLLYELTKQGVPAIIFDYTDGFRKDKLDPIFTELLGNRLNEHIVRLNKFNINPFKKQNISLSGIDFPEEDASVAGRIAESFSAVYKFKEQQNSAIYSATKSGLEKHGVMMNFEYLSEELEEINTTVSKSVLSKIRQFLDMNVFDTSSEFSWDDIVKSNGNVFIIQLATYTKEIQVMLTELILWDIWNYAKNCGREDNPFVVVLDEAQNISHKEKTPSGYILTEGRKFGVSGWYATQFVKAQMTDDEVGRLQQAGQKIYFAPPDTENLDVAKIIDNTSSETARRWGTKLQKLGKGECVSIGQMKNENEDLVRYKPSKIKVTSLEERKNGYNRY